MGQAGIAFIVLNFLRCLMVASLSLSIVGSIVCIAGLRIDVGTYFFSILGSTYRILACILLVLCEVPAGKVVRDLIAARLPVLRAPGYSLAWVGAVTLVIAASLLADLRLPPLNERSVSVTGLTSATAARVPTTDGLPHAWHAVVFAAGVSLGIMSIIYCLMPLVFWSAPFGEDRRLRHDGAAGTRTSARGDDDESRLTRGLQRMSVALRPPPVPIKISQPIHTHHRHGDGESGSRNVSNGTTLTSSSLSTKHKGSRESSYGSERSVYPGTYHHHQHQHHRGGDGEEKEVVEVRPAVAMAIDYTKPLVYPLSPVGGGGKHDYGKAWLR